MSPKQNLLLGCLITSQLHKNFCQMHFHPHPADGTACLHVVWVPTVVPKEPTRLFLAHDVLRAVPSHPLFFCFRTELVSTQNNAHTATRSKLIQLLDRERAAPPHGKLLDFLSQCRHRLHHMASITGAFCPRQACATPHLAQQAEL